MVKICNYNFSCSSLHYNATFIPNNRLLRHGPCEKLLAQPAYNIELVLIDYTLLDLIRQKFAQISLHWYIFKEILLVVLSSTHTLETFNYEKAMWAEIINSWCWNVGKFDSLSHFLFRHWSHFHYLISLIVFNFFQILLLES